MQLFKFKAVISVAALAILAGGCATEEHRMNVAEHRDDARRADFENCRAAGRTDCDAILNAPVNSNYPERYPERPPVREQERRAAYDRCVARGGTDCGELLDQ